jgi:hypothetical protein
VQGLVGCTVCSECVSTACQVVLLSCVYISTGQLYASDPACCADTSVHYRNSLVAIECGMWFGQEGTLAALMRAKH